MNTEMLGVGKSFSQMKLIILPGETVEQKEIENEQTFYVLNGVGTITIQGSTKKIPCRHYIYVEANTSYQITNIEQVQLVMLFTIIS